MVSDPGGGSNTPVSILTSTCDNSAPMAAPPARPQKASTHASATTKDLSCLRVAPSASAIAKVRRRSAKRKAMTRAPAATARHSPNPSSMRVSPARLTEVRLDPTVPRVSAMSVTFADGPTSA